MKRMEKTLNLNGLLVNPQTIKKVNPTSHLLPDLTAKAENAPVELNFFLLTAYTRNGETVAVYDVESEDFRELPLALKKGDSWKTLDPDALNADNAFAAFEGGI